MKQEYWVDGGDGRSAGPFTFAQVCDLARAGIVTSDRMISSDRLNWAPAIQTPEFFGTTRAPDKELHIDSFFSLDSSISAESMEPFVANAQNDIKRGNAAMASDREIPAYIRENLKQFDNHVNRTCLECGYVGMMGIRGKVIPWYASWWTIAFLGVFFVMLGVAGWIIAFALVMFRLSESTSLVLCPNCKTELTSKWGS